MLLLYRNITPNTSNGKHYLFTAFSNFKTFLANNLLKSVELNNYRINSNIIKVKIDTVLTISNYTTVTYIINELDNTCYLVNDASVQSGYVVYNCIIDYWGTYIADASLSNICVQRCNRKIANGIYQDINATKNNVVQAFPIPTSEQANPQYPLYYKFDNAYIVFTITWNVEQSVFGAVSTTGMFAISLKQLRDIYLQTADTPEKLAIYELENPLDIAINIIGGIYGVSATANYGFSVTNDAQVTKAYIVPIDLMIPLGSNTISIKSKSMYGSFTNGITVNEVSNVQLYKRFNIDINPNYEYYVGTINKGLKLIRTTDTVQVTYKCINNNNDLQIIVQQGDNQEDITSEYQVTLTLNDGDVTNLSGIFHVLNTSLKASTAIFSGKTAETVKGKFGALGSALGAVEYALSPLQNHFYGKQQGTGDGVATFFKNGYVPSGLGLQYPYAYTTCESINNEEEIARKYGAMFNTYVDSLASIFLYSLLGSGSFSDTYIQANVNVDGVPMIAREQIKQKLQEGLYLIKL